MPTRMIHQSFRYVLGRASYAVSDWVDWAVAYWDEIPGEEKRIIVRELEEAFDHRDPDHMGMECDRREWVRIRVLYK